MNEFLCLLLEMKYLLETGVLFEDAEEYLESIGFFN